MTSKESILKGFELKPMVISAPFGNYIRPKHCSATLGSFTPEKRKGLILQILKTLRPIRGKGGWVNALGLRNPSIQACPNPKNTQHLISIAALSKEDWMAHEHFIEKLILSGHQFGALELNLSCPNADILPISQRDVFALSQHKTLVAKLSPRKNALEVGKKLFDYGIRIFHLSNTLKTKSGGVSGAPLKPHSLLQITRFREHFQDQIIIIGGGGIRTLEDIQEFKKAGSDSVSIASICFNPIKLQRLLKKP